MIKRSRNYMEPAVAIYYPNDIDRLRQHIIFIVLADDSVMAIY